MDCDTKMDNSFCCLCLMNTVKLIDLTEDVHDIKSIIIKHFEFMDTYQVNESRAICQECLTQISEFHDFYLRIEQSYSTARESQNEHHEEEYLYDEDIQIKTESMVGLDGTEIAELIEYDYHAADEELLPDEEELLAKTTQKKIKRKKVLYLEIEKNEEELLEEMEVKKKTSPLKRSKARTEIPDNDDLIRLFINIKCNVCNAPFNLVNDVFKHCRDLHNVPGIIKCCGRNFKRRPEVLLHAQEHYDPKNLLFCNICNRKFKSKKNVENHKLVVHTDESEKPFSCDKCPKRFSLLGMLNSHRVFHEEKKCKCPICGKKTTNRSLLNAHMKIHEDTHQFMCEMCSKSYTCRRDLENHMFIHISEKVECDICGQRVRNLEKHKKSHVDLQLSCPECGKILATRSALKGHIKYQHRTDKAFCCTYCDRTFKKALNLKEHIATHTGEVLYSCPYCPTTFNSSANMYRHKKLCEERKTSESSS